MTEYNHDIQFSGTFTCEGPYPFEKEYATARRILKGWRRRNEREVLKIVKWLKETAKRREWERKMGGCKTTITHKDARRLYWILSDCEAVRRKLASLPEDYVTSYGEPIAELLEVSDENIAWCKDKLRAIGEEVAND